jgi:hypothetical protein
VILLAASCGKGVEKVVTLTFTNERPDVVTISTSTALGEAERGTPEAAVIEREREALLNQSDDWTVRFANADPEFERITTERSKKRLQRVERTGVVPLANLQRFFFDTPLTINVIRGEGWNELTILAGTSDRATRQQKEHVNKLLSNFSEHAAHYFEATRAMYDYLESNDSRAEVMFYVLAASLETKEKKNEETMPALSDTEEKLVGTVGEAIVAMVDDEKGGSGNVDRAFEATFNPFPGELRVVVPGEPLEVEGFNRTKEGGLVVKSTGVLEAVAMLEGKWLSPDPLARLLRFEDSARPSSDFASTIARQPRHAADVVRTDEVRQALISTMKPAERYRVRWIVKAVPRHPSS